MIEDYIEKESQQPSSTIKQLEETKEQLEQLESNYLKQKKRLSDKYFEYLQNHLVNNWIVGTSKTGDDLIIYHIKSIFNAGYSSSKGFNVIKATPSKKIRIVFDKDVPLSFHCMTNIDGNLDAIVISDYNSIKFITPEQILEIFNKFLTTK